MASRQNTNQPGGGMEGAAARVHLAAFGKHPGWDDHVDEQGIETQLLSEFKKLLYHEGIERNIREGRWESLPAGHREPGYGHVFLYRTGGGLILGRMWSSSDGKSRTAFPMILCAQITGLEMDWGLTRVLPALSALAEQCRATSSAAEVIALLDQARQDLRQQASDEVGAEAEIRPWPQVVAETADQEAMGPGEQGIGRVLYQFERELAPYLRGQKDPGPAGGLKARLMRLPSCSDDPAASLRMWAGLGAAQFSSWAPMLLIAREGRPWIDLIVGQPTGTELYCLQTTPDATPLSTDIPYELDAAFIAKVADMVAKSRQGTLKFEEPPARTGAAAVMASVRAAVPSAPSPMTRGGKINWTWIVAGAAVLIAALLLVLQMMSGGSNDKPEAGKPGDPGNPGNGGKANSGGSNLPGPTSSGASSDTRSQWRELCAAYEDGWGEFFAQMDRKAATAAGTETGPAATLWTREPTGRHLAELRTKVLQRLQAAAEGGKLDPRDIYGRREAYATLKLRPPPGGAGPERIGQAWGLLKSIEKDLADWSAPKALMEAKTEYEKRGWAQAAAEAQKALQGLATQPPTAGALLAAVQAADRVDAIAGMWMKLNAASASAGKMEDPIFRSYAQYLNGQIAEPAAAQEDGQALAGLHRRMTGALPLGQAIEDFSAQTWAKVDAAQLPMATGPGASEADFRKRMELSRGCVKIDPAQDARQAQLATWRDDLTQVETGLKRLKLIADGPAAKPGPAAGAPVGEHLKEFSAWLVAMEASVEATSGAATGQMKKLATSVKMEIGRVREQIGKLDLPAVERNRAGIEQESSAMRQALGRLKVSVIGDAGQWLAGVRKIDKISDQSPTLDDAWARGRAYLLPAADDAKLGQDPATFFDRKSRIEGLQEALGAIDKGFKRGIGQVSGGAWAAEMTKLADEVREAELKKAMTAIGLGSTVKPAEMIDAASWSGAASQYEALRKRLEESAKAMTRIGELLEAGQLPDEAAMAGEPSILALMETWRKPGVFEPALLMKVEAAMREPLGRVDRIATVLKQNNAAALAGQAAGLTEPSELRAAWKRLGELGWPGAARDLEAGAALKQKIEDWTRRLGGERGPLIAAQVGKEASERWGKCYTGLKDQKEIELAIGLRGQYAVKDQSLPEKAKFNIALHRMRAVAAQWSPQGKPLADPQAQEKIKALTIELEAASAAVASDAGVAGLLGKFKALGAEPLKSTTGQGADAGDGAGPASAHVAEALRWEKVGGTPEGQIQYRWKSAKSGRSHELTFHLVPGVGGDAGPIYLASSEMSIGLLIDAVEAASGWPAMQTLMERGEEDIDPRRGARSWEWVRKGQEMKVSDHWLQLLSPTLKQKPELCYPMGVPFTKPDANHPAQYVPPGAAMFVAKLMACRLPTRGEWEAALASDDPGMTGGYNLRDQTFAKQSAHVKEVTGKGDNLDDPEAGIFAAPPAAAGSPKAAPGKNDSTLWFEPVAASTGGRYSHLIGNVAELTFDQPDDFASKFKTAGQMTAPALKDYLAKDGQAALGVVGGSALSSPDSGTGWAPLAASSAVRGYSDVGFRLAYRVPHVPLALRALRLLEAQPYLSP